MRDIPDRIYTFLRAKGEAVYGVPLFRMRPNDPRMHGNDEPIAISNLQQGTEPLWKVVTMVAQ